MNAVLAKRTDPRLEQRRERLLEAGEKQFLAKGYAGASVNEIVRRAGGSLATLYNEFGSKEGLFAAIMRRRASSIFDCPLQDAGLGSCPEPAAKPFKKLSARAALTRLASRLLERRLSDDSLALYRIAVSEAPRFPALRKAILETNLPTFIRTMADALLELKLVTRRDSVAAAEEFVSMVHGQLLFRAACGGGPEISAQQRAKHVERVVDAFLTLHPEHK
jgi:TetR/AcrR family transcriptional repressor of mexJK operon